MNANNRRIIIIGAGYGGMALANLLAKRGHQVDVYEKNQTAGGRISAITQDGFTFDIGPSWYLMPEVFEQYYQLFGQSAQSRLALKRFTPGYKVFFEGHEPVMVQGDLAADAQMFESIEAGAGEQLRRYVDQSTDVYSTSVEQFLYSTFRGWRSLPLASMIGQLPKLLRLITRPLDRHVSTYVHDQRLKQLLEYHMVFLGSSPFQAPAIYSLMSHLDFRSGVYYPTRGMQSLTTDMQALGETYGVRYHYGQGVSEIRVKDGHAIGIRLDDGTDIDADQVVSNADLHHTETRLLAAEHRSFDEAYWSKRQPGPSAFLLSLGVSGRLPQLEHHNLYFVQKWRENFRDIYETHQVPTSASMYICNPSKTDASLAPADHENLFVLLPLPAGIELDDRARDDLAERIIDTLSRELDIPDLGQRIVTRHQFAPGDFADRYNAWMGNAFGGESHLLSQSVLFRTPNRSRRVKNLYYVGAGTRPGIGLPMCLISAQVTYKLMHSIRTHGPLTREEVA